MAGAFLSNYYFRMRCGKISGQNLIKTGRKSQEIKVHIELNHNIQLSWGGSVV